MKDKFLQQIATTRKENNISILQLSKEIGINKTTLIRNLKQDTEMSFETFLKICKILNLNLTIQPL